MQYLHVHTTLPLELAFSKSTTDSTRGSSVAAHLVRLQQVHHFVPSLTTKTALGGLIGLITALGCIPSGPKVSDTRIQVNMYLFFQDTARNVSEAYPGRIRIRYVSDTDTPPPRSIRVTEVSPSDQHKLNIEKP